MADYLRWKRPGGCYFFTVVSYKRRNIFESDSCRALLRDSINEVRAERPFETCGFCLLPNHFHCIWRLPEGDDDYSTRWSIIKRTFSQRYLAAGGHETQQTLSRQNKREVGVWQRRFWEHVIRDEDDYVNHLHYIHYNPKKHGFVKCVEDWPWSTYHKFCKKGMYDNYDWLTFEADGVSKHVEYNE